MIASSTASDASSMALSIRAPASSAVALAPVSLAEASDLLLACQAITRRCTKNVLLPDQPITVQCAGGQRIVLRDRSKQSLSLVTSLTVKVFAGSRSRV